MDSSILFESWHGGNNGEQKKKLGWSEKELWSNFKGVLS